MVNPFRGLTALSLFAVLLFSPVIAGEDEPSESLLERLDRELSDLAERVRRQVVPVIARHRVEMEPGSGIFFMEETRLSAVVCSAEGILVTLLGGVEGADGIEVMLPGREPLPARLGARDRSTGLAVLLIDVEGLISVDLSGEAGVRPGHLAMAVGNHHGLPETVRVGFVSSARRGVLVEDRVYGNLLQCFLPVGPGDGGGAVFGSDGRLVGVIHSRFDSETEVARLFPVPVPMGGMTFPLPAGGGMAFAVSSKEVRFLLECQERFGEMRRGWVGVSLGRVDADERSRHGVPDGVGGRIRRLHRNGPAYRAGLRRNDILLSWDGESVTDLGALRDRVRRMTEAASVPVVWLHRGVRREGTVEVGILTE